jgi:hypothetical protein
MIRSDLIAKGNIKDKQTMYQTRESKSLMGADRFYAENYSMGDTVVANKEGIIGKAGSEAKIVTVDTEKHVIRVSTIKDNKTHDIDLKTYGGDIQLYAEKARSFAEGDKILFLKNDRGLKVKNGETGYITAIHDNGNLQVKMDNGRELHFNPLTQYRYIGHGYALTDYKSQGQTAKHVIYHADTSKGVNFNQAYVGITRGKENVTIYTNDLATFKTSIQKEQQKSSTLDHDLHKARSINQEKLTEITGKISHLAEKLIDHEQKPAPAIEQHKTISRGYER